MRSIYREIDARRTALGTRAPPSGAPTWGLALSGGGIRSATFCLGLLRALAAARLLLRFDVLSTVSGGGYVGAMVGRLFSRAASSAEAESIEAALGDGRTRWFLWWLRANSRYLAPRGAKDAAYAIALYLRNLIGIHFELGMVAILVGCVLCAINLSLWQAASHFGHKYPAAFFGTIARYLYDWAPASWLLLPILLLFCAVLVIAYWALNWTRLPWYRPRAVWSAPVLAFVFLTSLWCSGTDLPLLNQRETRYVLFVWIVLVAAWLIGGLVAVLYLTRTRAPEEHLYESARNRMTHFLSFLFLVALTVVTLGFVERVAWHIAIERQSLAATGTTLALVAAAVRVVVYALPRLSDYRYCAFLIPLLGRALGYVLAFSLLACWIALAQRIVLTPLFAAGPRPDFASSWFALALLFTPASAYLWLTRHNTSFLNTSSLYIFYKARLSRSFLGAANPHRTTSDRTDTLSAIGEVSLRRETEHQHSEAGRVHPDDDIPFVKYAPQAVGGPVHFINACVNQTIDPRGGLFNRDRLGLPLTVCSAGLYKIAQEGWARLDTRFGDTLAHWTAISGAAASPGMGPRTRRGLSALLTFAGVRLGYWSTRPSPVHDRATQANRKHSKSLRLLQEAFGIFPGISGNEWFLSDGGHFDNTGAYSLLEERIDVIVVADCGADKNYHFSDLENLVRKARIDLKTEILFLRPNHVALRKSSEKAFLRYFGSLSDLASNDCEACLAVARVIYDERRGDNRRNRPAYLIVVKPNLCAGLPVDLINFRLENPDFPQQSTADQFFSEAQWESYFQLGQYLGGYLARSLGDGLPDFIEYYFEEDERSPLRQGGSSKTAASTGASRLSSRIGATAVGATIGLGAVATISVSLWQGWESIRISNSNRVSAERLALKELSEKWSALTAPLADNMAPRYASDAVASLAATLLATADTLCPAGEARWFLESKLAPRILTDARTACRSLPPPVPISCQLLTQSLEPGTEPTIPMCLLSEPGMPDSEVFSPLRPRYWLYGYTTDAPAPALHPCDPMHVSRAQANLRIAGATASSKDSDFGVLLGEDCGNRLADSQTKQAQGWQEVLVQVMQDAENMVRYAAEQELAAQKLKNASIVTGIFPATPPSLEVYENRVREGAGFRGAVSGATATLNDALTKAIVDAAGVSPAYFDTQEWRKNIENTSSDTVKRIADDALLQVISGTTSGSSTPEVTRGLVERIEKIAADSTQFSRTCENQSVQIYIFGPSQRNRVRAEFRDKWRSLGASVPPIIDISAIARASNRLPPTPVERTTIRHFHSLATWCVYAMTEAVSGSTWIIEDKSGVTSKPGLIEVWVAPETEPGG